MAVERGASEASAERIARNVATFRAANERISEAANANELTEDVPFICECAQESCVAIVRVSLSEYEAIRAEPTHFLNTRGHHVSARGHVEVIAENDRYVVARKIGRAGEVAEELDPRSPA